MSTEKKLTDKIGVNLTPEQKHEIRVRAAKQDMTISEYVRGTLFDEDTK